MPISKEKVVKFEHSQKVERRWPFISGGEVNMSKKKTSRIKAIVW
jgi:hypothetical protein